MKPTSEEVINELCKILDATPKKINGFMGPREKARELFQIYLDILLDAESDKQEIDEAAKKCALIAVDECIESTKQLIHHYTKGDDERYASIYLSMSLLVQYLNEVKQEINNL